ncbi:MAG: hypothetical protein M3Q65_01015 [Chloroflexota bacterium]|nr:hypothetical protein [Chloroflexota bacterium]
MSVDLYPAPLAATAAALRAGDRDPVAYADDLCDRAEAIDGAILSLLPERRRRCASAGRTPPPARPCTVSRSA